MTKTLAQDTQHFASALENLHRASLCVLDALTVQTGSTENADAFFSKEWKTLFDAVENKMKKELADAASEHALDAAVQDAKEFAL